MREDGDGKEIDSGTFDDASGAFMSKDRERLKQAIIDLRIYDHLVLSAHLDLLTCLIRYEKILAVTNRCGFAERVETSARLLGYLEAFVAQRFCYGKCFKELVVLDRQINDIHALVRERTIFDEYLWKLRNKIHHEKFEPIHPVIIPLDKKDNLGYFFIGGYKDWSKLPPVWSTVISQHFSAVARTFDGLWNELSIAWSSKFGAKFELPPDTGAPHLLIPPGGTWPAR